MAVYTIKSGVSQSSIEGGCKLVKDSVGRLHTVYFRTATKSNIFHSYSDDNGKTWTEEPITNDTTYNQYYPSIAIDSQGYLHVVWIGESASSPTYYQIRYSKYTTSWSSPVDLTSGSYSQYYSFYSPYIVIDSNDYLHVVWYGKSSSSPTYDQIRYLKYTNSWSSAINITSENYNQQCPSIAVDSNNYLHVVWEGVSPSYPDSGPQIRYSKYVSSWSPPIDLTTESDYRPQHYPTIAIDSNNNLHVVWEGTFSSPYTSNFIRYSKYTTSWSSPIMISSGNTYEWEPHIVIDSSNNLHVVWYGDDPTYYEVIRYTEYTTDWSNPISLLYSADEACYFPNPLWTSKTGFCFVFIGEGVSDIVKFYITEPVIKRMMSFIQFERSSMRKY